MTTTPLVLRLDADDISPADFGVAVNEFAGLLADLDRELSPGRERSLRWRVTNLGMGSATMSVEAEPLEDAADIGPELVTALVEGFPLIREGLRPSAYSDEAIERVRRLTGLITDGVRAILVTAPSIPQTVSITRETAAKIESIIGQGYTSVGAIEGTLEALSIHGRPTFTVYDAVTGRAVRCEFPIQMKKKVVAALGYKVLVHGNIRRDPAGRPTALRDIDTLRRLGLRPVVQLERLAGLLRDMDRDTREYVAEMRGE